MITNNNMNGKIKGKSIWNFVTALDWELDNVEDRLNHVRKILGEYQVDGVNFYHEYFDEVFNQDNPHSKVNLILSTSSARYDESNISKALEIIESYILCSRDEIENRKKDKIVYKIYNSKELLDRFKQEENLTYKLASVNSDRSNNCDKGDENKLDKEFENVFAIFQLPKNYKKVKDIVIEKKDFERFPILKEYQHSIDHMESKLQELMKIDLKKIKDKKVKDDIRNRKNILKKNLRLLKLDMLDAKKMIERPIIWKSPLKDSGCADYDLLDMFDKEVVKELLRVHKGVDLQDDLSCILVDLENLINKIEFTDKQRKVLELWSNGLATGEISKKLNVKPNTVVGCLNSVVDLIIKQYEKEYEEWYYLNIRKGIYKKCSRCGEVKLVSQFDKDKKGKYGVRGYCKNCYNRK